MFSRRFLRIKVIKALYSHFKSGCDSMITSEKNLVGSIDKAYDLYFQMLRLVADVKVYAEERIELGRNKKLPTYSDLHPNLSFVENGVIAQIEESAALNARLEKAALGWNQYPELIKHLYTLMSESEYYKRYMQLPTHGYASDRTVVEDFYIETVQNQRYVGVCRGGAVHPMVRRHRFRPYHGGTYPGELPGEAGRPAHPA